MVNCTDNFNKFRLDTLKGEIYLKPSKVPERKLLVAFLISDVL